MRSRWVGRQLLEVSIPAHFVAPVPGGLRTSFFANLSILAMILGVALPVASAQTNEWTWVGGTQNIDDPGVYGILGVASSSNLPMSRDSAVTWTDAKGNFWLFGGQAAGRFSLMNDFWKRRHQTVDLDQS